MKQFKSEEGLSSKAKKKPKAPEVSPVSEWEEEDEDMAGPAPPPRQASLPGIQDEGGWLYTLLADIQKTQKEILAKVNTMHEQAQQERQRLHNMELRVENLQEARMLGLTSQTLPPASSAPSGGTTLHINTITEGPVTL